MSTIDMHYNNMAYTISKYWWLEIDLDHIVYKTNLIFCLKKVKCINVDHTKHFDAHNTMVYCEINQCK